MSDLNIAGSISTTGTSILGAASVIFSTDANHTLSVSEYTNKFLECTSGVSLTATRNLVAPVVQGQEFVIQNATTGGHSIQIIGSSGIGITITNGSTASVVCDGTNYLSVSGSAAGAAGGDLSGAYPNPTVIQINSTTVPAGGSLTTGNQLIVTGPSALGYAALNLAGGAGYVSGSLPAGNQASQTMGGDTSGTTASATVIKLQGNAVQSGALGSSQDGYVLTWKYTDGMWEPRQPATGGLTIGPIIWSPVDAIGSISLSGFPNGQQCGTIFTMRKPNQTITGVRFNWGSTSPGAFAAVKISLWAVATTTRLASASVSIAAGGVLIYTGTFASSVPVTVNTAYAVTAIMTESGGGGSSNFYTSGTLLNDPTSFPFFGGPYLDWISFAAKAATDVYPASTATTERYPVEPIFQ